MSMLEEETTVGEKDIKFVKLQAEYVDGYFSFAAVSMFQIRS